MTDLSSLEVAKITGVVGFLFAIISFILAPLNKSRRSTLDIFRRHERQNHTYFSILFENLIFVSIILGSGYAIILLVERLR